MPLDRIRTETPLIGWPGDVIGEGDVELNQASDFARLQDLLQILPEIRKANRVTQLGGYTRIQKEQPEP